MSKRGDQALQGTSSPDGQGLSDQAYTSDMKSIASGSFGTVFRAKRQIDRYLLVNVNVRAAGRWCLCNIHKECGQVLPLVDCE